MAKEAAGRLFRKGLNCAQSVFAAHSEMTGISVTDSLKITTGFGAGMAMMQKTCGAVAGAYMVIGAKYGRVNPDDEKARDKTYGLIEEFNRRFIELHGSLDCRELMGVDLKTKEGAEEAEQGAYFEKKCGSYVDDAEKILDELL
ncbi:MAG TPA: C_GCAxxG_C_C family protein [Bacteroides sp.]|nr:C_GCAxxG_C_C family protein [Bacteroides sp.]